MTYFADLTPYTYGHFTPLADIELLNIGWLSAEHPFAVGKTNEEFRERVRFLVEHARMRATRGYHWCEMCDPDDDNVGSAEIRVVGEANVRFAAPTLVHH